mgnify:CR=1 FL=1
MNNNEKCKAWDDFCIEHNIPVPMRRSVENRYPFAKLDIGDSFTIDVSTNYTAKVLDIHQCCKSFNKRNNTQIRITTRYIKNQNLIRVWRIE